MLKITDLVYDINTLNYDLGWGCPIRSKTLKGFKKLSFKSIGGLLKYACKRVGVAYHKCDWTKVMMDMSYISSLRIRR